MSRAILSVASVGVAVLVASSTGCDKGGDLEKLRKDGYGCTKAGAGAMFAPKPGEHCFVCPDDASMAKCQTNPVTSGCKEEPGCGKSK